MKESEYWDRVFARSDPWNYSGSPYEQTKYRHTLEMMPDSSIGRAAELGCAEGIFTTMVAPLVDRLLAVDISNVALDRAKARCLENRNVTFAQHDISDGMIGADYDLVICSEILYYLRDSAALERFACQVRESVKPGGHLLMTHPNMVSDDNSTTGFDFNEIGAGTIGTIFSSCPGFEFVRELRTELYRVQLFRRRDTLADHATAPARNASPREALVRSHAPLEHPSIKWGGCAVTAAEARHCWVTTDVPILMYHRIADEGPDGLAPYRLSPQSFERQLAWLQRQGFHGIDLVEFCYLLFARKVRNIPGKPIVLTFDDAYADFYSQAWPLLRHYGFSATVFVPTNYVGGHADWDASYGPPAPIMSWEQIAELQSSGIQFGSHSCSHVRVADLPKPALLEDAIRSRQVLASKLGADVPGYCYPYAYADPDSRRVMAEAGYRFAVCGTGDDPVGQNDPFYIRRIEIFGSDTMDQFIAKLPKVRPSDKNAQQAYAQLRLKRDRATYMGI